MATITVEGFGEFQIEKGRKLVTALEDNGVDILHRCGGNAKCTTCRIEVLEGDFGEMNEKEKAKLESAGLIDQNIRLSCQVLVDGDVTIRPVMTVTSEGKDAGPRPLEEL